MRRDGPCDADDDLLVDRFLGGDCAAFDVLVRRYQDPIFRFVSWSTSADEATEAAQDVFVEAYRSLATWRGQSTFRTWLYGLARNVCRHRVRQAARRQRIHDLGNADDVPDHANDPLQRLALHDESARLMAAIARLPHAQRVTLLLRAWEGLSYEEIATVTDVPKGTVRSRLHTARQTLARIVGGERT